MIRFNVFGQHDLLCQSFDVNIYLNLNFKQEWVGVLGSCKEAAAAQQQELSGLVSCLANMASALHSTLLALKAFNTQQILLSFPYFLCWAVFSPLSSHFLPLSWLSCSAAYLGMGNLLRHTTCSTPQLMIVLVQCSDMDCESLGHL